ncbi:phage host-nuclease inhibitor protein Gam [Kitasatospora sp. MAA4]|uniref:outer membrane protein assembly factor BamB family protein n=1 Tax=Kitasatospora sp. MAA4 TaxID=3035093 RepID=UPI0024760E91|nr:PQQ-binding-like beta-propeller repeat protein [Kitasatospora sp. MAA4]MDH6132533.1 phage host-nuclease inhibitor protein Gam [Kitasatospora sp. MAA4]
MIADAVPVRSRHDPVTGLWTLTAPGGTLRQPVVTEDAVLLLVGGKPTALDLATGQVRWRAADGLPECEDASPVLRHTGNRLVVASDEPGRYWHKPQPVTLTGLDTADGTRAWVRDAELLSDFLVDESTNTLLLWQSRDAAPQHLTAVDLTDGTVRWRHELPGVGGPLLVGDRVIASVATGLRAFHVRTGTELWRNEANAFHHELLLRRSEAGEPVVAAVILSGGLAVIAPDTGERLRTIRYPRKRESIAVRGAGRAFWSKWPDRLLVREPLLGPGRPERFLIRTPLAGFGSVDPDGIEPIELDGRIYAVLQPRYTYSRWRRILPGFAGQRVHTARTGRALALLRPLPGRVVKRGAFVNVYAGPDRLYLTVAYLKRPNALLAYRNGTLLWSTPLSFPVVVPFGDRLLALTDDGTQDHLRLIDGQTGEQCQP